MTREEIAAQIRLEFPFFTVSEGSVSYNVYPDELPDIYEEMVQDRVDFKVTSLQEQSLADARIQKTRQFSLGMKRARTNLSNAGNKALFDSLTANQKAEQLRIIMVDTLESVIWLAETLRDYGTFKWDDL